MKTQFIKIFLVLVISLSASFLPPYAVGYIASDLKEGELSLQEFVENALAAGLKPAEVVTQLIDAAGVNPILGAEVVTQMVPSAALEIAKAAAKAVPAAASDIAGTVAQVVPKATPKIAGAVAKEVPKAAASIASTVAQVVPKAATSIAGTVAKEVPQSAPEVASAVAKEVPQSAPEVASAVAQAVPQSAPGIASAVAQVVLDKAVNIAGAAAQASNPEVAVKGRIVWRDTNGNGIKEATEPLLSNVQIMLIDLGKDGRYGTKDDFIAYKTKTNAVGRHPISNLPTTTYTVIINEGPKIAAEVATVVPSLSPDIAGAVAQFSPHESASQIAGEVAIVSPKVAPEIASAVAKAVPQSAPEIASAVAQAVPQSAPEIASAVAQAVPQSASETASAVAQAVPQSASAVAKAVPEAAAEVVGKVAQAAPEAAAVAQSVPETTITVSQPSEIASGGSSLDICSSRRSNCSTPGRIEGRPKNPLKEPTGILKDGNFLRDDCGAGPKAIVKVYERLEKYVKKKKYYECEKKGRVCKWVYTETKTVWEGWLPSGENWKPSKRCTCQEKCEGGKCVCDKDKDSDGDGTPDCDDLCPDYPNKTAPGKCGCGHEEPASPNGECP